MINRLIAFSLFLVVGGLCDLWEWLFLKAPIAVWDWIKELWDFSKEYS